MEENVDIIFQGKIVVKKSKQEDLIKDFDELLKKHESYFQGSIHSFEFTECEVIEENEEVRNSDSDL